MSLFLAAQDFQTPDKGGPNTKISNLASTAANKAVKKAYSATTSGPAPTKPTAKSVVTPAEPANKTIGVTSGGLIVGGNKHVRFGAEETAKTAATGDSNKNNLAAASSDSSPVNAAAGSGSKRGAVSRRGGRYVSPGRPITASQAASTYRTSSPVKTGEGNDTVPTLCSTNSSGGLVSVPSECEKDTKSRTNVQTKLNPTFDAAQNRESSSRGEAVAETIRRPTSISCDPLINITSPLAAKSSPRKEMASFDDSDSKMFVRSPVPSTSNNERLTKTPTKSPGQFQSLPSLDDPKLGSPTGFILSPGPLTPSYKAMRDSFEKESKDNKAGDDMGEDKAMRDYSKEKYALTPTNFSVDYGKSPRPGIFDTSNVLNWLQSPTANGLFSPGGGLNSIMNTPRGPIVPRTPGTPTVSTSFFFSDVASLPRNGDNTPKLGDAEPAKSPKKGLSNIICISPLASSRNRNGGSHAGNTPINYHDVFASPNPLFDDTPMKRLAKRSASGQQKGSNIDPSLDAVHQLAERDLMQDEDLSVLLQLAGGNTPKGAAAAAKGGHVFRGSGGRDDGVSSSNRLQLPIIGDRSGDSSARLSRKSFSRDHGDNENFVGGPSLGIQKSGSAPPGGELFPDRQVSGHPGAPSIGGSMTDPKVGIQSSASKPAASGAHPYPVPSHSHSYPPRPPDQGAYSYPSMPPHGMRATGRMSVVVGGPPPSARASKPSIATSSRHLTPATHRHPSYSQPPGSYPPPGMSYPPPHGHYPHHPHHAGAHPYHPHYGAPPRHPHPPHPSHMPMYGAQHPHAKMSTPPNKKNLKPGKAVPNKPMSVVKRPSIGSDSGKPAKKQKKSPGGKRKNKSPQLTDRADRQKAAQTIAAVNAASGGKNDKAAALAAAILRGVTMRPSGKWQAQLYFAGKSRYIGVFDTREKAALAYEIAREKLKSEKASADGALTPKQTENAVNAARQAAFDGVNEKDPRVAGK